PTGEAQGMRETVDARAWRGASSADLLTDAAQGQGLRLGRTVDAARQAGDLPKRLFMQPGRYFHALGLADKVAGDGDEAVALGGADAHGVDGDLLFIRALGALLPFAIIKRIVTVRDEDDVLRPLHARVVS